MSVPVQTWGAWQYAGGNGMRVGIGISWGSVSHGSSSVTATISFYVQNQYTWADNGLTLNYTGSLTNPNLTWNDNAGAGATILLSTITYTYNYASGSYGSSPGHATFGGQVSGTYNGITPSVSVSSTIPARPYAAPAAPTGVTSTRNTDTQATITWTNNSSSGAPYSSHTLQMATYTGSSWGSWVTIASPSGGATSQVVTGLSANHEYSFRILASNSAGSSAYAVNASYVFMTPAAPTGAAAALGGGGITVSWTNHAYTATDAGTSISIDRSNDGGSTWTNVASGLAQATTNWTDGSPGGGTIEYRVYAKHGSLSSAYAITNTVASAVPPNAPTNLEPNGYGVDFTQPQNFVWQHNPGLDYAAATEFSLEYSTDGGTTWTAIPGATNVMSGSSQFTVPGGTFTNTGVAFQWRVQDMGVSSAGYSPWSAAATVTGYDSPTVAFIAGFPPNPETSSPVVAEWAYAQDQGLPQQKWRFQLQDSLGNILEDTNWVTGTAATYTSTYPITNGATYTATIYVMSSAGQIAQSSETFLVAFAPPALPTVSVELDQCTGSVSIEVTTTAPGSGEVTLDNFDIQRSINGGPWTTLIQAVDAASVGSFVTVIDTMPITNGDNQYQLVCYSAGDTTSALTPTYDAPGIDGTLALGNGNWVFVNYGSGFATMLRFHGDPQLQDAAQLNIATQPILGRQMPVALIGDQQSEVVTVQGSLHWQADGSLDDAPCNFDSPKQAWLSAFLNAGVVLYRDYTGRRLFGVLSAGTITDQYLNMAQLAFTVTEIDYNEDVTSGGD